MTLCFQRSHSLAAQVNLGKFYALYSLFQHVDNHISSIYSQPLIQESLILQFKIRYAKGLFLVSLILQVSLIQHIIYILLLLHESFVHLKIFSQKISNKVLSSMLVISFSFFFIIYNIFWCNRDQVETRMSTLLECLPLPCYLCTSFCLKKKS